MKNSIDLFCWQHVACPEAPANQRASAGCICQPLAFEALHSDFSALRVIDSELCTSVHAEIELGQIAIKMLLVHMLIDADHASLEDGEKTFQGIGMHIAARPLILGMVNRFVLRFRRHNKPVGSRSVSDQSAVPMQMLAQSGTNVAMV